MSTTVIQATRAPALAVQRHRRLRIMLLASSLMLLCTSMAHAQANVPSLFEDFEDDTYAGTLLLNNNLGSRTTTPGELISGSGSWKAINSTSGYVNFIDQIEGFLLADTEYLITFDYQIIADSGLNDAFFAMCRSATSSAGSDIGLVAWNSSSGMTGTASVEAKINGKTDYRLIIGIHGPGTIIIDNLHIRAATTHHPADGSGSVSSLSLWSEPADPDPVVVDRANLPDPGAITEISVAAYGASPSNPDNFAAFQEAIIDCEFGGADRLIVPPGVYRFTTPVRLYFHDMTDFVFDGQGAEFVFTNYPGHFIIKDCIRSEFKNFKISWDTSAKPLAYVAQIVNAAADRSWVDFDFIHYANITPNFIWKCIEQVDPANGYTPGIAGGWWDIFYPVGNSVAGFKPSGYSGAQANRVLRISPNNPGGFSSAEVGDFVRIRTHIYESHAMVLEDSSHCTFENIDIYSCPGMGFTAYGDVHHFALNNYNIKPRPATWQPVTTTADGIHLANTQGYFKIENSELTLMGDDAFNFHDKGWHGFYRDTDTRVKLKNWETWRDQWLHVGDLIEFRNSDYSPTGFSTTIVTKSTAADGRALLTFADPIPAELGNDSTSILFNRRYDTGHFEVRGNYIHEHRARGMVVTGHHALIENNVFYKTQGPAMSIQVLRSNNIANYAGEGTNPNNIIVRNNKIANCDLDHWRDAMVQMFVWASEQQSLDIDYPIFSDILFADNEFTDYPEYPISIRSAQRVTVRDNLFRPLPEVVNSNNNSWGGLWVQQGSDIAVYRNHWEGVTAASHSGVYERFLHVTNLQVAENTSTSDIPSNTEPVANISSEYAGTSVELASELTLTGSGLDVEDGELTGASLVWTSSINGFVGTGESLSTPALSNGWHVITLTATDSGSLTGTASVSVLVGTAVGRTIIISVVPVPELAAASLNNGAWVTLDGSGTATLPTIDANTDATIDFSAPPAGSG